MSPPTPAEVAAAQRALAAEHATVWAYGIIGPRSGDEKALDTTSFDAHRNARDDLIAWLTAHGEQPVAARPGYELPFRIGDSGDAAALARRVEDGCCNAFAPLVAASADSELRKLAVDQLIACATRRMEWGGAPLRFPGLPGRGPTVP